MSDERKSGQRRSEFDFIARIRQQTLKSSDTQRDHLSASGLNSSHITHLSSLSSHHSSLLQGIGDDAAVIKQRGNFDTVITTDLLVEGIDFDLDKFHTAPRDVGHKALAVSLSDIAAMGARPRWSLVSIGLPRACWETNFLDEFYKGYLALAGAHDVALIGGDISRTPKHVVVDSIVLGEVERKRAVLRSSACPGDRIYVTGALGGAAAGLKILQQASRQQTPPQRTRAHRQLIERQMRPTPRIAWGQRLATCASAMIDLSDGLSSDLAHLCHESGVGAMIDAARIPVDTLIKRAGVDERDALALALNGGEDFELLFTARPRKAATLPDKIGGVPITYIGDVTGETGKVRLIENGRTRTLKPSGFQHFKRTRS